MSRGPSPANVEPLARRHIDTQPEQRGHRIGDDRGIVPGKHRQGLLEIGCDWISGLSGRFRQDLH